MKRDMDLIRTLLLAIEANPLYDGTREFSYEEPEKMGVEGYLVEEVSYHLGLLIEADYVKGRINLAFPMPTFSSLTWSGHEFLDNIKDVTIWNKTKAKISGSGLTGAALSVVAQVALAEVKKHLGLP